VALYNDKELIGFGRIIGDGGTVFQVTDVVVLPEYQGKGLGKRIMTELTDYIKEHAPKYSYVSLIADGPADKLYEKYGFKDVKEHASKGMYLWLK
jgi:ribosomal protein S18 acetylase RimI-like enzyme